MPPTKKASRSNPVFALDSLPDDVLPIIFNHISTRDKLIKIQLVCRRFHGAVYNQYAWKHVKKLDIGLRKCFNYESRLLELPSIPLCDTENNDDDDVNHNILRIFNLITVPNSLGSFEHLSRCRSNWFAIVNRLPEWAPSLTHLDISDISCRTDKVRELYKPLFTVIKEINQWKFENERKPLTLDFAKLSADHGGAAGIDMSIELLSSAIQTRSIFSHFLLRNFKLNDFSADQLQAFIDAFSGAKIQLCTFERCFSECSEKLELHRTIIAAQIINKFEPGYLQDIELNLNTDAQGPKEIILKFVKSLDPSRLRNVYKFRPRMTNIFLIEDCIDADSMELVLDRMPNLVVFEMDRVPANVFGAVDYMEIVKIVRMFLTRMRVMQRDCEFSASLSEHQLDHVERELKKTLPSKEYSVSSTNPEYHYSVIVRDLQLKKTIEIY